MGGLSRDFLNRLKLEHKDVAVIDTEAGIEHLGRVVAGSVDMILLVLDPSYESIRYPKKSLPWQKKQKSQCTSYSTKWTRQRLINISRREIISACLKEPASFI
jgi:CO dehydrogenase nickel-insertion accessory protein CooC1